MTMVQQDVRGVSCSAAPESSSISISMSEHQEGRLAATTIVDGSSTEDGAEDRIVVVVASLLCRLIVRQTVQQCNAHEEIFLVASTSTIGGSCFSSIASLKMQRSWCEITWQDEHAVGGRL